ncbi:CPBP family intramembrane metalloprotease [Streptomyces sp. RY43-2]|uniref:CPBP family intramembrane metalloprotease n=1 Tax=Streptomyces macrolidinus TaxID=2952607 RepID=A0ABT0Z9G4_9ACTN|nr:CPBP family intramembrane glutamic endopeptidase [Streptomyces macrolidinus]MCN9240395.1 CPBP family intramembrane metalloprotease [Streptomyces macrolidinus]
MQDGASAGVLTRRQELAETGVFLLLIVPSMALSFFTAAGQSPLSFPLIAASTILRDVGLVALILLLLSRGRQPVTTVGWVRGTVGRETMVGILLTAPVLVGMQVLNAVLRAAGLPGPRTPATGLLPAPHVADLLLAVVLVTVVAIAEETIFRGYLISRLTRVLRSRTWAMLLSSALFSIGHGYQGVAGVLTVGATGMIFALVYVWRHSLVAPIVTHFCVDLIAIVVVPLLLH